MLAPIALGNVLVAGILPLTLVPIPPCGFVPMSPPRPPTPPPRPVAPPVAPVAPPAPAARTKGAAKAAGAGADGTGRTGHMTEKRFSDLAISAESRRALAEAFGYEFMTAVQAEALPLLLQRDGRDCLAKAKTGTGKTLAFMIPAVEGIAAAAARGSARRPDVRCLVVSPTRELAQQIGKETERLLAFHEERMRKVVVCVGGTNKNKDAKALRGATPIVVATPGRLLDHLQNSDLANRMANLDCLILDEADQLLDMGFRPDVERILRLLQPSANKRQTLLFLATIPDQVSEMAGIAMRPDYHFVDTVGRDKGQTHAHVRQQVMVSSQDSLLRGLFSILERETAARPHKVIVFFTTARLMRVKMRR